MISVVDRLKMRYGTGPLLASFLFLLVACSEPAPRVVDLNGDVMGTTWHVRLRLDPAAPPDVDALTLGVQAELDRVDRMMSTYKPDSELSQLNRAPVQTWHSLSAELASIIGLARSINSETAGAFDVTVGPIVNLWGFGPEVVEIPATDRIDELMARVGNDKYELQADRLYKHADVYIDLSGIAKGYAVDRVAGYLEQRGYDEYLVEVGGELRASVSGPSSEPWRVAVERPDTTSRTVYRVLPVTNGAVATSGNYRNFVDIDGTRYSHTIDPSTGWPVADAIASATVITESAAVADAMATALLVMGPDAAMVLAERANLAVLLLVPEGDGFAEISSSSFAPYLE